MASQGWKQETKWKNQFKTWVYWGEPENLVGHILRLNKETPTRKAIKFIFEERWNKTFRGRNRATIHAPINRDIKKAKDNTAILPLTLEKQNLKLILTTSESKQVTKTIEKPLWNKWFKLLLFQQINVKNNEKLFITYIDVEETKQRY